MARIFLLDPDEQERSIFVKYLQLSEYELNEFSDAVSLLEFLKTETPSVLIIEADLPDIDGFKLAKQIADQYTFPFMFLTHRGTESDRIIGFELGADEYIVKPCSMKETILRIEKVLRLVYKQVQEPQHKKYAYNGRILKIMKSYHKVLIDNQDVNLTATEWKILLYLTSNENVALSRENILQHCLEVHFNGYQRIVDTHIKKIRMKLLDPGWVETIRGHGYRFAGKNI